MDIAKLELRIDPDIGAWVPMDDFGDEFKGVVLKVRAAGNVEFERLNARLFRELPAEQRTEGVDPADRNRINNELLCQTILLDWRGFEHNGEPVLYSAEMARKLIFNPKALLFRAAIVWAAERLQKLGQESLEEDAKN